MVVKVTLGEPMCRDVGAREKEVEFPGHGSLTIAELATRLGLTLSGSEGALIVIVNGEVLPSGEATKFRLRDKDHVELHMMLAGG